MASVLGIPQLQVRLNGIEKKVEPNALSPGAIGNLERRVLDLAMAHAAGLQNDTEIRNRHEIAVNAGHIENRLKSLNEALVSYVDAQKEIQQDNHSILEISIQSEISRIQLSVDTIRRQSKPSSSNSAQPSSQPQHHEQIIGDALYVALENHFRGSRDVVAQRQQDYLPLLPSVITESTPLIDLGCGRGEWLRVLKASSISAIGVDSNSVCIAECEDEGLAVVETDLLKFLMERPDASVGTYTMFQVLEHLPFPILVEILREIRRTLVPGGRLIAEVPNAKNLRVSAGTFWIDPTHQRPLFPELLLFLATEVGFNKSEGRYTNNLAPDYDLSGIPEGAQNALRSVVDAVDGAGDFALIATA